MDRRGGAMRGGYMTNEHGFALMGVLIMMIMIGVLGVAGLTYTGLENRMAGFASSTEAGAAAAESCIGTSVNVILQTVEQRAVPASYVGAAAVVPVNAENISNPPTLSQEIMAQADNHSDVAIGTNASPDIQMTVGSFNVVGDIDRLYLKTRNGGAIQFANGYEGTAQGAGGGGAEAHYQIDCIATLTATGTSSRIRAVYACVSAAGEGCQRKI